MTARIWEPDPVTAVLLAHQGGWDEILMVLVPIVIFGILLVVANRRAGAIDEQRQRDEARDPARRTEGRGPDGPAAR
jgi:hypothetical protein